MSKDYTCIYFICSILILVGLFLLGHQVGYTDGYHLGYRSGYDNATKIYKKD